MTYAYNAVGEWDHISGNPFIYIAKADMGYIELNRDEKVFKRLFFSKDAKVQVQITPNGDTNRVDIKWEPPESLISTSDGGEISEEEFFRKK